MNTEIRKALERAVTHIAKLCNTHEDEVLKEMSKITSEDTFIVVPWPDCQEYMDKEGWSENSFLINDDKGLDLYGSSAYFVNKSWLETGPLK